MMGSTSNQITDRMNFQSPIFILGCQRSGTTLSGNILGAHPECYLLDEEDGVYEFFEAVFSGHPMAQTRALFDQCVKNAATHYRVIETRFSPTGKHETNISRLVFKVPNLTYDAELLRKVFPDGRFVFPIRDIRAVVASMGQLDWIPMVQNQLNQIDAREHIRVRFSDLVEKIRHPEHSATMSRAYVALLKMSLYRDFQNDSAGAFVFRYEDLITRPELWIRKLLAYCNLIWDNRCQRFQEVLKGWGPGMTYRARAIDTLSHQSWKYTLSAENADRVWEIGLTLMHEFGYKKYADNAPIPSFLSEKLNRDDPVVVLGQGFSCQRWGLHFLRSRQYPGIGQQTDASQSMQSIVCKVAVERLRAAKQEAALWRDPLRASASFFLADQKAPFGVWGWSLSESSFALNDIAGAFPNVRVVHLIQHPLQACIDFLHQPELNKNPWVEWALRRAYVSLGRSHNSFSTDSIQTKFACLWLFQLATMTFWRQNWNPDRFIQCRVEDIVAGQGSIRASLASFLQWENGFHEMPLMDPLPNPGQVLKPVHIKEIWSICRQTALSLGYLPPQFN